MTSRDSEIYRCPECGDTYKCPKCGEDLIKTEADGLWCNNGCYESEYALWVALQEKKE